MAHTCHAIGCKAVVPPEMFMCKKHWFTVPQALRNRIWATYRHGQCDDWQPSAAYCDAAKAAVIAVAEKEGRAVDPICAELMLYDVFRPQDTLQLGEAGGEAEEPEVNGSSMSISDKPSGMEG